MKVTPLQNEELTTSISMMEVHKAAKHHLKNKASGEDTISTEFFIKMWDTMDQDVTSLINTSFNEGHLYRAFNNGLISFFLKGDTALNIKNYCTITVLTTMYKLVADTNGSK
uniref:Uncharacterized protein n=1 Tax=Physcomitrium patens TaxID=3218 RepID=A9SUQ7_PHYPA|nr:hypothetical protein PHYPA_026992 [Physcomitrium patens]